MTDLDQPIAGVQQQVRRLADVRPHLTTAAVAPWDVIV